MAEKSNTLSPMRVAFEHAPAGNRASGLGSELSLGGLFIETETKLPVGSLLSLELESGTTKVALDARILSCRAAGGPDRPAGFAVSFIDLPNDVAASLQSILAARSPRKGTMLGLGEAEDDIPAYESERKLRAPAPAPAASPLPRPATPVIQMEPSAPAPVPAEVPKQAIAPTVEPAPPYLPGPSPSAPMGAPGGSPNAAVVGGIILLIILLAVAAWLLRTTLS